MNELTDWVFTLKLDKEDIQKALDKVKSTPTQEVWDKAGGTDYSRSCFILRRLASVLGMAKVSAEYGEISKMFSTLRMEDTETIFLIGCLRYTYGVRDKIDYYNIFLREVEQTLISRKEDYENLLMGLYD